MFIPDDTMIASARKSPVTFGLEIEQPPLLVPARIINKLWDNCHYPTSYRTLDPTSPYDWCIDGSNPRELVLDPSTRILSEIKKFILFVQSKNATWDWVNEYHGPSSFGDGLSGCGSHIHFRLREEMIEPHLRDDAWATLYNTILEVSMLMLPMLCHGSKKRNSFCFRKGATGGAKQWAQLITTRYRKVTFGNFFIRGRIPHGRHYWFLTPNKRTGKVLTLELRANEAHPSVVYCFASYITRIIREVFDRGMISPKLANRGVATDNINNAYKYSTRMAHNLYDALKTQVGIITFQPGRGIPRLKEHYSNYLDCFDDILIKHHLSALQSSRVEFLFRQRGEPWKNSRALWDVLTAQKAEFKWDQPHIWSPDETGGRMPKKPKAESPEPEPPTPEWRTY